MLKFLFQSKESGEMFPGHHKMGGANILSSNFK